VTFHKFGDQPSDYRPWLAAVGSCELVLGRGAPILQAFARCLIRNAGHLPRIKKGFVETAQQEIFRISGEMGMPLSEALLGYNPVKFEKRWVREVTLESRLAFQRTWGVSVDEQIEIERQIDNYSIDLDQGWRDLSEEFIPSLTSTACYDVRGEVGSVELFPAIESEFYAAGLSRAS